MRSEATERGQAAGTAHQPPEMLSSIPVPCLAQLSILSFQSLCYGNSRLVETSPWCVTSPSLSLLWEQGGFLSVFSGSLQETFKAHIQRIRESEFDLNEFTPSIEEALPPASAEPTETQNTPEINLARALGACGGCPHFTSAWASSSPCMCPSMLGRRGSPQTQAIS